jgi:hypothetical protein
MSGKIQEKAFAEKIKGSPEFVAWLLSKTKFKDADALPVLVRSGNPWCVSSQAGEGPRNDATFLDPPIWAVQPR